MGTNAAYGGSGSAAWTHVRDEWTSLGSGSDGASSGSGGASSGDATDDGSTSSADGSEYDSLVAAIAGALRRDDRDARRKSPPSVPLSSVLAHRGGGRGGGGGAGGGHTDGGGSRSGSRHVTAQAARGGSAIGAAYAYRDRDAAALAGFGLSLEELDGMSPRMRCARILEVAIGQAGHPDEQAMREASLAQIKALVSGGPEAAGVSPLEAIRDFIAELTFRIGLIELTDQILTRGMTADESRTRERGLRSWIRAKASRLDLGRYGQVSATEFHNVARQMSADVLRLLGGVS